MSANELVEAAERLVASPETSSALWLRAASLLFRAALEEALQAFWLERAPGLGAAPGRTQLACLESYVDDELARETRYLWGELSTMAHHRSEEGPDPLAVRRAGGTVRRVTAALEAQR